MITQIEGRLVAVQDGAAHVRTGDVTYEVLIPAADSMALAASKGEAINFHTLHYLEGQGQGSSFWPRLIGFRTPVERDFFELFTTVKGIGNRKALRALQLPFVRVAEAISERDLDTLQTLPEIGKRTAEAICVELKGKVDAFVVSLRGEGTRGGAGGIGAEGSSGANSSNGTSNATSASSKSRTAPKPVDPAPRSQIVTMANSAVEVLVQLGHTRPIARDMVERVLSGDHPPTSAGEIVTAALR